MTISSVTPMWSRKSGQDESQDGKTYKVAFSGAYQVVHEVGDTLADILNHVDVPQIGDVYSEGGVEFPGVFCKSRSTTPGLVMTIVAVEWSGEVGEGGILDDPLNKEPEIIRSNRLVNAAIDCDFNGQPITNVNGEPVEGITTDISDFTITIKRNFASLDMYAIRAYLRSHNSDTFDGWPPGTARFRTYTATELKFNSRTYYEVSATIEFREPYNTVPARAWWARYRNEGWKQRVGVTVVFTSVDDGTGAAGYAITNSSGAITKIVVTNRGRGYVTAPTVAITSADGSGATATAVLNTSGEVTSVTITAGGTGYRSKLVKCTDSNEEPVTRPALLAADGSQLEDASLAVWLERPLSGPLPYSALGLL